MVSSGQEQKLSMGSWYIVGPATRQRRTYAAAEGALKPRRRNPRKTPTTVTPVALQYIRLGTSSCRLDGKHSKLD